MKLEAGKCGHGWRVVDAATGREIIDVTMLNDSTKEMRTHERDANGDRVFERDSSGKPLWIKENVERVRAIHIDQTARVAKVFRA